MTKTKEPAHHTRPAKGSDCSWLDRARDLERVKFLLVGVGGQGVLTAAKFLGDAALLAGQPVMVSQLHGMSQRGGSVEGICVMGSVNCPQIGNAEADVVLGLEPLEALRALPKMAANTKVVVNLGKIMPFHFVVSGGHYPSFEEVLSQIRKVAPQLYAVDGPALAQQIGEPRTLNVILLGALAGLNMLPFDVKFLWQAIEKRCPPRFLDVNKKAFELGIQSIATTDLARK